MKCITILLLLSVLFFQGCTGQVSQGNSFRIGSSWEIPPAFNGNPWSLSGQTGFSHFIYEPLFIYNPISGKYIPALAEDFEVSANGKKYTVKLRNNVVWQDGSKFTSKDVQTSHLLAWMHNFIPTLTSILIIDDFTLEYNFKFPPKQMEKINFLTQPINSPSNLYDRFVSSIPDLMKRGMKFITKDKVIDLSEEALEEKKYLEKGKTKIREKLYKFRPEFHMGTGPFKMKVITSSDAVLIKFKDYWNSSNIFIDKINVIRWPSNEVMWASLISGDIDASHPATPYDVTEQILKINSKMKIITVSDLKEFCFVFNFRRKPLSDLDFRRAIAHIIDKDQIRKNSYYYSLTSGDYNQGIIESLKYKWIPKEYYKKKLIKYDFSIEKGKKILLDSGYKINADGFFLDHDNKLIQLEIICQAGATDWVLGAEIAANQLQKAGIKASVRAMEPSIYQALLLKGEFDMATWMAVSMPKYVDPATGYDILYGKSGFVKKVVNFPDVVSGPDGVDENTVFLINKLINSSDNQERKKIIEKFAWISNKYLPFISIYEKNLMIFIQDGKHVKGWPESGNKIWSIATMGIESLYSTLIKNGQLRGIQK